MIIPPSSENEVKGVGGGGGSTIHNYWYNQVVYIAAPASYPDVSLSMKMCAQRKAGRRAVCTLPMVPCGSLPVARLYNAKNEAPEEEAVVAH